MSGAVLRQLVRTRLPLLAVAVLVTVVFLGSFVVLGVAAFYVWACVLTGCVIAAALHDTGDDQ